MPGCPSVPACRLSASSCPAVFSLLLHPAALLLLQKPLALLRQTASLRASLATDTWSTRIPIKELRELKTLWQTVWCPPACKQQTPEQLSPYRGLTDIPNRRAFDFILENLAQAEIVNISIWRWSWFDIDFFKSL